MFPIVASVLLALVLLQPTRPQKKAPNCTGVWEDYPTKVRDPLFEKIPKAMNQTLEYNCTLEDIASATANFDDKDAYVDRLYDEIPNLNQTVYKEEDKNVHRHTGKRLEGLNVSAFIDNATRNWADEFDQMREKTQFGCFLDDGYNFTLVCAFV